MIAVGKLLQLALYLSSSTICAEFLIDRLVASLNGNTPLRVTLAVQANVRLPEAEKIAVSPHGLRRRERECEFSLKLPVCARLSPDSQGHLVFQYNPDEGQSLYRLGSQPTASCRNVRMACPPEQANRGVT